MVFETLLAKRRYFSEQEKRNCYGTRTCSWKICHWLLRALVKVHFKSLNLYVSAQSLNSSLNLFNIKSGS